MYLITINSKIIMKAKGLKRAQKLAEEFKMMKPKFNIGVYLFNETTNIITHLWDE